eukprot:TRINITY_DN8758_c0_g1_i1.p2 TRINITY_DN8758_c0_g1~~TRINITY_DN8758_c0_g1_i1.p2  ORF type:complete len:255 (-),score=75.32 TRINITY_DN8758_c0_g1_i1:251-1015(-)
MAERTGPEGGKASKRRASVARRESTSFESLPDELENISRHLGIRPLELFDSVSNVTQDLFCDAVDTLEYNFVQAFPKADPQIVKECADELLDKKITPKFERCMDKWELYVSKNSLAFPAGVPMPPEEDSKKLEEEEEAVDKELAELALEVAKAEHVARTLRAEKERLEKYNHLVRESLEEHRLHVEGKDLGSNLTELVSGVETLSTTLAYLEGAHPGSAPGATHTVQPSNIEQTYIHDAAALDVESIGKMSNML